MIHKWVKRAAPMKTYPWIMTPHETNNRENIPLMFEHCWMQNIYYLFEVRNVLFMATKHAKGYARFQLEIEMQQTNIFWSIFDKTGWYLTWILHHI